MKKLDVIDKMTDNKNMAGFMDGNNSEHILYSIGHSTHTIEKFICLLQHYDIEAIADVRSSPYSQFNPQFNREILEQSLKSHGIAYVFLGKELGAQRKEPEFYHDDKVDYDLVSQTPSFHRALERLIKGANNMKVAILCAEKDPLVCHRTILIARHAKHMMNDIHHILADGSIETQEQVEKRLLSEYGLQDDDFFTSCEERLNNAYHQRAVHIAYKKADS